MVIITMVIITMVTGCSSQLRLTIRIGMMPLILWHEAGSIHTWAHNILITHLFSTYSVNVHVRVGHFFFELMYSLKVTLYSKRHSLFLLPSFRLLLTRGTLSMLQNVWLEDALMTLRSKKKCKSICLPLHMQHKFICFSMSYEYELSVWIICGNDANVYTPQETNKALVLV